MCYITCIVSANANVKPSKHTHIQPSQYFQAISRCDPQPALQTTDPPAAVTFGILFKHIDNIPSTERQFWRKFGVIVIQSSSKKCFHWSRKNIFRSCFHAKLIQLWLPHCRINKTSNWTKHAYTLYCLLWGSSWRIEFRNIAQQCHQPTLANR